MPIFCTKMQVYDRVHKQLTWIDGPRIDAPNWSLAEEKIIKDDLRWLIIYGELVSEIPCKENSFEPHWKKEIDYQKIQQN